ncbi:formylglycine-generating enzyme family protein [Microcoleus sp. A003_D6]|uniref:formylglycine-generating enzyme family protein n=1 Tax=Microcoleus sp. A003_D6 TaxID=3055266 RepID=UPI002FD08B6A
MTKNQNQPREYDAVKGGQNPPPIGAAVLGGFLGVKSRLASPIVEVRIAALSEAMKYGDAGLDLIIGGLQNESMQVKLAAYSLLKDRDDLKLKPHFPQDYLPTFDFDVITVDAEGKENSRRKSFARFFPEDLGKGVMLEMVYIPGGTFMMGSPATEENKYDREDPQHQVTVPTFFAGKYPITQAQWQAVMGNNPSYFKLKGEKLPVEEVSWEMAVEFCVKLSQNTGQKYRLLNEAEWEYACRAGTTTPFYFGENITPKLVHYHRYRSYANAPANVGSFLPNAFGLYDMHGTVWEWCSDRWHDSYNGAPTDGSSWETGTSEWRVQRGGSWKLCEDFCRSTSRNGGSARDSVQDVGFRVALVSA